MDGRQALRPPGATLFRRVQFSATRVSTVQKQKALRVAGLSAALNLETQLNRDGVHKSAADQSRKDKTLSLRARSARGTPRRMRRLKPCVRRTSSVALAQIETLQFVVSRE